MNNQHIYTVTELSIIVKDLIEGNIPPVWVKGEISNLSQSRKGHIYFSLKDKESLINCVLWRDVSYNIPFNIENGMSVIIFGEVVVYTPQSQYQIKVYDLKPAGIGNLYLEFLRLKEKLAAEGLFDESKKKSIPFMPRLVGVITSSSGAAIRDILNISRRRNPAIRIIIFPALVQGEEAADTIVEGIKYFNKEKNVDLIIISRGGGSLEDLWAFNEEKVVRAINESEIPIISAVGHEIDFTLSDFAADLRAPTPSAAAEIVFPDRKEIFNKIEYLLKRIERDLNNLLSRYMERSSDLKSRLYRFKPENMIMDKVQRLDELEIRLYNAIKKHIDTCGFKLKEIIGKLNALNPKSVLNRGYSIVYKMPENKIVKRCGDVKKDDSLSIEVSDGNFGAVVN
ncbi:MAG: exodeoxyribonuclease VII large subunit [Candidatus Marinimicrobia bacterium]|nr:exodeoxyribonuclease VII large subunit [Candidatus Neomarinimicrobiota bacterium]